MGKVIFLDRDGIVNVELPNYVKRWEEFKFLPTVLEAFKLWRQEGFRCFVVSNQSCVARGLVTDEKVREIMEQMRREIEAAGGKLDAAYYCPHAPEISSCDCRKPALGLYYRAAKDFGVSLADSYSIGDMERDIEAGKALCQPTILVRTGKGANWQEGAWAFEPDYVADNLLEAARLTVELENKARPGKSHGKS